MNQKIKKQIRTQLEELLPNSTTEDINQALILAVGIVELASEKDVAGISVNLPPFMSFRGGNYSPVDELITAWKLDRFVDMLKPKGSK